MDYGLRILNDALKLQIDSLYQNYCLWEHGENITTQVGTGGSYSATITFSTPSAQPPLIAIKPSSSRYCGLTRYTYSGGNYTGFVINSEIDYAATIDWMAFVPMVEKSSEAYGLRVYNPSAQLVFDSGWNSMIILDVDTCSPAYNSQVTITHPDDSDAYFIESPWGGVVTVTGAPPNFYFHWWLAMFKYLSDTQVSFGGVKLAISGPAPSGPSGAFWPALWTILTVKKAF